MYQKIQKDNNLAIDSYARKRIEFALSVAVTTFVLPIEEDSWKYMLASIHSINGNNFVIIDGKRQDMPDIKSIDGDDFLYIYNQKVKLIMESAKNYIIIMYERNGTGVYDWMIVCPRDGKFYQVAKVNSVAPNFDKYEVSLSHCVMESLRKSFVTAGALSAVLPFVKHYFNANLCNNTETANEATKEITHG